MFHLLHTAVSIDIRISSKLHAIHLKRYCMMEKMLHYCS